MTWAFRTARELRKALKARKVSALELAKDAIARIERHDGRINAVCVRDFERALKAARAADKAIAQRRAGPLAGIPMTVKESFNLAGTPTTWGFVPQKDFIPKDDALIVARCREAGAVVLGKTNVPVSLADWQSYNDIYGVTGNPFDPARTPGGSSGGSSAALAAGYGPLSLGSDIGGSLRAPAHFCGVYAHKPTYALVPSRGHTPPPLPPLPFDRDLAVVGPMAISAGDLSDLLDVIAGPDPMEAGRGYRLGLPAARHSKIRGFRILVLDTHPLMPVSAAVREPIGRLAAQLAKEGAKVARTSDLLPDLEASSRLYMHLLFSFLAANFPAEAYEGLPVGAQIVGPWLEDRTPLKLAELIERSFGGFVPPPGIG